MKDHCQAKLSKFLPGDNLAGSNVRPVSSSFHVARKIEVPKPQAHKGMRGLRDVFAFIPIIQRTCYTKMRVVGMMLCIVLRVDQSKDAMGGYMQGQRRHSMTRRGEREAENTGLTG